MLSLKSVVTAYEKILKKIWSVSYILIFSMLAQDE